MADSTPVDMSGTPDGDASDNSSPSFLSGFMQSLDQVASSAVTAVGGAITSQATTAIQGSPANLPRSSNTAPVPDPTAKAASGGLKTIPGLGSIPPIILLAGGVAIIYFAVRRRRRG